MDSPTVHVMGAGPRKSAVAYTAVMLDGSAETVMLSPIGPTHDPALGWVFTDDQGRTFKPLDGARILPDGHTASGPGYVEEVAA
jgi:hypothetical protein